MTTRHKIITAPVVCLIGQAVVLLVILWLWGNLTPDGLGTNDDAREYVEQSHASFQANLSSYRTFAYPLFLRFIRIVSPEYALVPWAQFLLHALAVGCFYFGLRALVSSDWLALIVASSLLYSNTFLCEGASVLTDAPASSLAIATLGLLLLVVAAPRRLWIWAALALCLFLTYQTRPSYQFLIVLVPALGALLVALVGSPRPHRLRHGFKLGAGLAVVGLVPFLAFCTLRWVVVGDFGLVSFDGYTLSGITGPLLTEDIVPRLPDDVRPLAKRVIELRDWTAAGKLPPTFRRLDKDSLFISDIMPLLRKEWPAPEYNGFGDVERGIIFHLRGVIAKAQAEDFHIDRFQWAVCLPAAQEFAAHPDNPVEINRLLKRLSLSIAKARPLALLKHRLKVVGWIAVLTLVNSYALAVLVGGLLLFEAARQLLEILYRLRRTAPAAELPAAPARDAALDVVLVSCIVVGFTLANILLLGLIAQPLRRYTDAGGVFVPALAALALVLLGNHVRRAWICLRSASAEPAASLPGKVQKLAVVPPELTRADE